MNENLLTALLDVLQKQANSIRKLTISHIALSNTVRRLAEESGLEYAEFEQLFLQSLSDAEASEPSLHYLRQDIAKEIEKTIRYCHDTFNF